MKKISKYLLNGFAVLFFALTAYIIVVTVGAMTQNREPNIFGHSISVVATDSMEDTIMVGDFIVYNHDSFDKIEIGDVVVFNYIGTNSALQGKRIVHRIVGENLNGTFETRGDKYSISDGEELSADNYVGKVVFYTSLFGLGNLRLNYLGIFFGFIMIGFLILIIIEIKNFSANYKKLQEEERVKRENQEKK